MVIVVVLGRVGPGFVGDAAAIGQPGALLGELESSPLGLGEDRRLSPGGDQVESHRAFPAMLGVLGVHIQAAGAAVDLTGSDLDQLLSRSWQGRAGMTAPDELMYLAVFPAMA
jgi:hypothetical protein